MDMPFLNSSFVPPNVDQNLYVYYINFAISVVGFLNNFSFITVLWNVKEIRTKTNLLLLNLAVADIHFLISRYVFYFLEELRFQCAIFRMFYFVPLVESCLTISLVSVERYVAVCHPYKARRCLSNSRLGISVFCTWIFSFMFSSMYTMACFDFVSPLSGYHLAMACMFLFCFILLLCISLVTLLYVLVAKEMYKRSNSRGFPPDKLVLRENRQVFRTVCVTAIVHFCCIFPATLYFLVSSFTLAEGYKETTAHEALAMEILGFIVETLLTVNSSINPFIYKLVSSKYRKAAKRLYMCISK